MLLAYFSGERKGSNGSMQSLIARPKKCLWYQSRGCKQMGVDISNAGAGQFAVSNKFEDLIWAR